MLERHKVKDTVVTVLEEIQTRSGRELSTLSGSTCPVGDLAGFDSLNAVEATTTIAERLGCSLPPSLMIPSYGQSISVDDIVDSILGTTVST
jgi:acyl carrier protein